VKNYTVKVFEDGSKCWCLDGQLHREDGPAIERASGAKHWYLHGNHLTEEEHKRRTTGVTMDDALAAADGVLLREQAERIAELEERISWLETMSETDRLRAKKKQIYEDLQDAVESEWVQTRMMLAAPELLEALKTMLEMSEMGGFGKAYAEDVARAAIAKAKGE